MVRPPLSENEHVRGRRLGILLRHARGERSIVEVATAAGLSAETLRKIETGRVPTPAFFTVAAVAVAVGLSLDEVAEFCGLPSATASTDAGKWPGVSPPLSAEPAPSRTA